MECRKFWTKGRPRKYYGSNKWTVRSNSPGVPLGRVVGVGGRGLRYVLELDRGDAKAETPILWPPHVKT